MPTRARVAKSMPRSLVLSLALLALVGLGAASARNGDILLYNHSPSVPVGFYLRTHEPVSLGAFVTVRARDVAPLYAQQRGFAGPGDRFVKRVAALGGAAVCADGDMVFLDPGPTLTRLRTDAQGRALPHWKGCRFLAHDEVWLLGDTPDSFDSRYWGPVRLTDIEGVWRRFP